jgi:hypothetical protein
VTRAANALKKEGFLLRQDRKLINQRAARKAVKNDL